MKSKGFALIEILIYVVLSATFILSLFQFTFKTYTNYKDLSELSSNKCCVFTAMDLIIKDLQQASSDINTWKKITNNEVIFSLKENKDIGWAFRDQKLYRIEGTYSYNKWSNPVESLALKNVVKIDFRFNELKLNSFSKYPDKLKIIYIKILCKYNNKQIEVEKSVNLKNGNL